MSHVFQAERKEEILLELGGDRMKDYFDVVEWTSDTTE